MVKYENAKIYIIVDNAKGNIYIGSTWEPTLAKRLAKHVGNYKDYKNDKYHYVTLFDIIKIGDYNIILLEHVEICKSKDELHARERYYIENNECVNKCMPTRTKQEYRENKDK